MSIYTSFLPIDQTAAILVNYLKCQICSTCVRKHCMVWDEATVAEILERLKSKVFCGA